MTQIQQQSKKTPAQTSPAREANSATSASQPIRFVAQVAPVKEVILHGSADLAYWNEKLLPDGFQPIPENGQAQLFLSATEARFWGIQFRECIVGIQVRQTDPSANPESAMYLLHAWNSLRAFAWVERTLFSNSVLPGENFGGNW